MASCRVVAPLLLLAILGSSTAFPEVTGERLQDNVRLWAGLQKLVNETLIYNNETIVNPFALPGFLSPDRTDGAAVILSAKGIVPDLEASEKFRKDADDVCGNYAPPDNYKRLSVPLFTLIVMHNASQPYDTNDATEKFEPYICALRQQTEMVIFLRVNDSLVYPPLGDLCNTMILIRQVFHSARFLVAILTHETDDWQPPLCRPIVWGNLSPFLQIRRDRFHENAETLIFLASKGGSINFIIPEGIHNIWRMNFDEARKQPLLRLLYATFDNTAQLAFRASRIGENKMVGPRFAFPDVEGIRNKYSKRRKELTDYLESEGEDMTRINIMQILLVLLFAGIVTMIIAVNPQYYSNDYEKLVEVVEEEVDSKKEKKEKLGVLATIKNALTADLSKGRRIKKSRTNKESKISKTIAEVTAEGENTNGTTENKSKRDQDDKASARKKRSSRGLSSFIKRRQRKSAKNNKTSENEITAENTMGTTAGTEITAAAATQTLPSSN